MAVDVKSDGNFLTQCYRASHRDGREVLVFNPTKATSCAYDPFAFLRASSVDELARNAQDLAVALIPLPQEVREPVWITAAQNLLAGSIIYYFCLGSTFTETMLQVQLLSVAELIEEIDKSGNTAAKIFISKLKGLRPETPANIGMELASLAVFASDPNLMTALDVNCKPGVIDWSTLNTSTSPCVFVLQIPEAQLEVWAPLTALVLAQLIRTLEHRADKHSTDGHDLPPILVLLDEFPRLGKILSIKSGLTTLRSRGVTFCLVLQSLVQLDEIYGEITRHVIVDSCEYFALLNITDPMSQKFFSDFVGTIPIVSRGFGVAYNPLGNMTAINSHFNEAHEPVLYPQELAALGTSVVLITPFGYFRAKKAAYFQRRSNPKKASGCL